MPRLGSFNATLKPTRVVSVFGEFTLTTPSTVSFVVPLGVTSVNIACVGGGGGGTTWTGFLARANTGGAIGSASAGGSGGKGNGTSSDGSNGAFGAAANSQVGGAGGSYGGGAGSNNYVSVVANTGQRGFVRIIWGPSRSLPNVNSDNLTY